MGDTIGKGGFDPSHGLVSKDGKWIDVGPGVGYAEPEAPAAAEEEEPAPTGKASTRKKG